MSNKNRFVIHNDAATPLIVNIEPECVRLSLPVGERVTVCETFQAEPLTLKVESEDGTTIISIWPGDGDVDVEKDGANAFDLIQKGIAPRPLLPGSPHSSAREMNR